MASKLLLLDPDSDRIGKMALYCFNLARYDQDYDVRDRGRLLSTLLSDMCPILKGGSTLGAEGADEEGRDNLGKGTITLRLEQIRMVLMQGKEPSKEETDPIGCSLIIRLLAGLTPLRRSHHDVGLNGSCYREVYVRVMENTRLAGGRHGQLFARFSGRLHEATLPSMLTINIRKIVLWRPWRLLLHP